MPGCETCATKSETQVVAGCRNNGSCQTGKMDVFDWLSHMDIPTKDVYDVVEVRFKSGRKDFYKNQQRLQITTGDAVVVDVPNGHHVGYVSLMGELVRLQLKKKNIDEGEGLRYLYRLATRRDLEKFENVQERESAIMYRTREIIEKLELSMKLTDVEFQADNTKATFFYSAEERVDFRELIKVLASEFKVRIEMRQISLRQEAGRIGGIGSCGRELCCSTWLTDFKSVSTSAARYQNLSLNPGKLSGQCGRLKCCLNYELSTYMEALRDLPEIERPLLTSKGEANLQKTDIFKKILWFGYEGENSWIPVPAVRVFEILELNKKGKHPETLLEDIVNKEEESAVALNSDLEQLDRKFRNKGNRKKKKRRFKPRKQSRNQ